MAIMKIWNVEHGLAIHIESPNKKWVVIDLGSTASLHPIKELFAKNIDLMVLTHPHFDHISDILYIDTLVKTPGKLWSSKAYTLEEILAAADSAHYAIYENYFQFCESYNGRPAPHHNPAFPFEMGGMTVNIYNVEHFDKKNANNASPVHVVRLGEVKMVICGDNEDESLCGLLEKSDFCEAIKDAHVLVAPHHGREKGYVEEFVNLVNPLITIISDTIKSDTSVADKYEAHTRGWNVQNAQGDVTQRKCLTTRKDGNIEVILGADREDLYIKTGTDW